jgi:acid phosphatase
MSNMVDDDHDTSIGHMAQCLHRQLFPLFANEHFNDKIIIVLSLDKNESYAENNFIVALLLGSAITDSAWEVPTTRHPTRIAPPSP